MNTKINYFYRDADNYKSAKSIILDGKISKECLKRFRSILDEGEYFIPSDVGLENLQSELQKFDVKDNIDSDGFYNPFGPEGADHVWHTLDSIELTNEKPTTELSNDEFCSLINEDNFIGWDVEGTEKKLISQI